jgi:hypothetical protein
MKIRRRRDGGIMLSELPLPVRLALLRLPFHLQTGADDPANARLFPDPGGDADLGEMWAEWVRPDLARDFDGALAAVRSHLQRALGRGRDGGGLVITPRSRDAWMHVLNRARLSIFERAGFSARDLDGSLPETIASERDLLRWELMVYQVVLEVLVEAESER